MQPQPVTDPGRGEVHLLDYWRTIWRSRWMVAGIFAFVVTVVAIATFTQKPVYRAVASVEITPQSRKVTPMADVADLGTGSYGWFAEERYFNTQYEIVKSRDVVERVFDRLDLYDHPQFKNAKDPIGAFVGMIHIAPVKDTGIIQISMEGLKPEEVALWVNSTAEAYVDRNLQVAVEATSSAMKSLLAEISPLRSKLEDSQRTSFEFAEKSNVGVPENQQKVLGDRLSTLQTDLTDAQVKRSEVESVLRAIDNIRSRGGSYDAVPQIANDPVVQELMRTKAGLERDYQKLLLTYKEKHIRVQEAKSEIDKITQKIDSEAERVVSNFKTELALLRDRETSLAASIQETRSESLRANQTASSFDLIHGEAAETKRIYDLISTRIKEISLSSSLIENNLRVLDKAPVPEVPVKPRVLLNLAIGIILGLLLGAGTVFFLDYLDNTVRTSEDIEQFLGLTLLAIVPREEAGTRSAVREAYQTLRTGLLFSRKNRTQNLVLLTSAGPQEGKSRTSINLARTIASSGERVIVLDCDLRRPTVHQHLGIEREPGITNYILSRDEEDWTPYLRPTDDPNLFAMTCGPIPPNPAEVFAQERFQGLIKELRAQFDWVFVDSPPLVSLADSVILATMSDMVVFVIKHNENDKELIRRCVASLRRVNANLIGAVLNQVDLERSHYKDYYYVGYYYYGQDQEKKGRRRRGGSETGIGAGEIRSVG